MLQYEQGFVLSPLYGKQTRFCARRSDRTFKYGLGSVMSCNEEHIVIKFDDHGEKKFVLSIALPALKKSDRQPPVEKRRSPRKKATPVAANS